jgi:ABC-type transport system involved in Fe-S cluster assembly fused permease/ATPase subunit
MSQLSFNHLLNLSFAFHTRRKTGEILRVLDRGAAINRSLEVLSAFYPYSRSLTVVITIKSLFCSAFYPPLLTLSSP